MDNGPVDNEFWRHFKVLASQYLNSLVTRISGQLDSMLLFSALFSAINTAIVVSVLPTASDEMRDILRPLAAHILNDTNIFDFDDLYDPSHADWVLSAGANTVFLTALGLTMFISLLSLLAKQWITEFKPDVYGCSEEGYRELPRKLIHSNLYHLSWVTEAVPFLLVQSVLVLFIWGLFLLAYASFSWTWPMIFTLLATASLTTLFILLSTLKRLQDERWPYYNPINMIFSWWSRRRPRSPASTFYSPWKRSSMRHIRGYALSHPLASCSNSFLLRRDLLNGYFRVQCVCWVLEVSSNDDALRAAASMIPTFKYPKEITIILMRRIPHYLRHLLQKGAPPGRGSIEYAAAFLHILVAAEKFLLTTGFDIHKVLEGVKCRLTGPESDVGGLTPARPQDIHLIDPTLFLAASLRCMTEYGVEWHANDRQLRWTTSSERFRRLIVSNVLRTMTSRELQVLMSAINVFHNIFLRVRNQWDEDIESAVAEAFHEAKHSLWAAYRSDEGLEMDTLINAIEHFAVQDESKPILISGESSAFQNVMSVLWHHLQGEFLLEYTPRDVDALFLAIATLLKSREANRASGDWTDQECLQMYQVMHVLADRITWMADHYASTPTGILWEKSVVRSVLLMVDLCETANFETMLHVRHCLQRVFANSRRSFSGLTGEAAHAVAQAMRQLRSLPWLPAPAASTVVIEEFLENVRILEADLTTSTSISDLRVITLPLDPLPLTPAPFGPVIVEGGSDELVPDQQGNDLAAGAAVQTATVQAGVSSVVPAAIVAQSNVVNTGGITSDATVDAAPAQDISGPPFVSQPKGS